MGRSSYRSKKKLQELNEQKLRRLILNTTTTQNHYQTPPTEINFGGGIVLDTDDHSAILEETKTLCTVQGIHSIKKFLIPFIENTKSLKERRDHALAKILDASTNLSQIQQLKSKLESHTKGKLNVDDSEADLNKVITKTTASITEIEEEMAKLQASKKSLEELLQTVEELNRLRKEAPEIMAANMELELIQLESKDIENKALFFIKMVEKL